MWEIDEYEEKSVVHSSYSTIDQVGNEYEIRFRSDLPNLYYVTYNDASLDTCISLKAAKQAVYSAMLSNIETISNVLRKLIIADVG